MRYLRAILFPLIALAVISAPVRAEAGCTYVATTYSLETTCTLATEAAPTLVTEGFPLRTASASGLIEITSFTVHVEATAGNFTGGTYDGYVWNVLTLKWNLNPDLVITVTAGVPRQAKSYTVTGPVGRVAFVPTGVGQASKVWIVASGE